MDFEALTEGEHLALVRLANSVAEALGEFRHYVWTCDKKAQAALLEYRKAHEALERALTTISVRKRFAAKDGKEAAV